VSFPLTARVDVEVGRDPLQHARSHRVSTRRDAGFTPGDQASEREFK